MPRRLTFNVGPTNVNAEPVEIELIGTDVKGQPAGPFVFTCIPEAQGTWINEVIHTAEGVSYLASDASVKYIRRCLIDDAERTRFDELANGSDVILQTEKLTEIFQGLVQEYGSRPTSAPSPLPVGTSPIATTSMGADSGLTAPIPPNSPSPVI